MERLKTLIDVPAGIGSAVVMSVPVWVINASHGPLLASIAALKQGLYTFFMGGIIIQLCNKMSSRPDAGPFGLALAILVPCVITIGATFAVHSLKGTPEPIASTIPIAIIAPLAFSGLTIRARRALQ